MNDAVKILSIVSYKFLPPQMGGQKNIAFFNRYLAKHVSLLCAGVKGNTHMEEEGYPVINLFSNSNLRYINPLYFFKLRRLIKEREITHLIIEHPYYGWLGMMLKWFCAVKLIVHSHNIEALRFKSLKKWWWGILWNYEKLTHRNADFNFFITDFDREYAITKYGLKESKCAVITFGIEQDKAPALNERAEAREAICKLHAIEKSERILLFNGTLDYKPNLEAVNIILKEINPQLLAASNFKYKIIICGNKLPAAYNELADYKDGNIIYAGFVKDISMYFKGADIFLNPVIEGGGIKTKVVEALGYGCSVISTKSGAVGIPVEIVGAKMIVVEDSDWINFAKKVTDIDNEEDTAASFFEHFSWTNIGKKAASLISK